MYGTCALCQTPNAHLQNSHALPRFAYKRIRADSDLRNPNPVQVTEGRAFQTSKQKQKHLLCFACEQRIAKSETYLATLCQQPDGRIPIIEHLSPSATPGEIDTVVPYEIDCEKLAYFAVSVVWRADLLGGNSALGDRYREQLRRYLLGLQPFPAQARAMLLVLDGGSLATNMGRVLTMPITRRFENCREHSFIICGFVFTILLGCRLPVDSEHICLVHADPKRIIVAPAHQSALVKAIVHAGARGIPSRALAAWAANHRRNAAG